MIVGMQVARLKVELNYYRLALMTQKSIQSPKTRITIMKKYHHQHKKGILDREWRDARSKAKQAQLSIKPCSSY